MLFAKPKLMALWCGVAELGIGTGGVLYQTWAGIRELNQTDPAQAHEQPKPVKAEGGGDTRQKAQTFGTIFMVSEFRNPAGQLQDNC
jgi:hypothetical protein